MSGLKRDESLELRWNEHGPSDLDAEVYRNVMGGKPRKHISGVWEGGKRWQEYTWLGPRTGADSAEGIPPYSTDPRAAFEVVEVLRARGWWLTLRHCGTGPGTFGWFADWTHEPTQYRGVRTDATAETAPEAICRAALQAVRGKEGKT